MFKNRIATIAIIGLLLLLIVNSVRSVLDLKKAGNIVTDYENDLDKIQKENQELKSRLLETQKPEFIEREARDKLGLGKQGESVVILPETTPSPTKTPEKKLANWEKWWKLFF